MSFYNEFCSYCEKIGCEYSTEALLRDYTSFRIGGKADVMVFPDSAEKFSGIIKFLSNNNIVFLVIGKGSNLLVSDNGFKGVVINTCRFDGIELADETTIVCDAGISLSKLCRFALDHSLEGLEFAFGIPGTAGGAAYMNAGAYGGEMKDVLISCKHINKDGEIKEYKGEELALSYRHSAYSDTDNLILSLTLKLRKGDKAEIKSKMDDLMGRRRDKQPLEFPSAGSTFKRPEGYFAGALIEECGLKGFTVGGAQVSEKHAGFVINTGNATAKDVIGVIDHCKDIVYSKKGVILEPEVKIIGRED